jgi:hypothetical protein
LDTTATAQPSDIRTAYLAAAASAADLLADPAVGARWDLPSALEYYKVGGLAGHLAGQVFFVGSVIDADEATEQPIDLLDYYDQAPWITAGPDEAVHVRIRTGSEANATDGPEALVDRVRGAVDELRRVLPGVPADRRVHLPTWGPFSLRFDDFVRTRLMELVVHSDDLAVSVEIPTPALPETVTGPVITLLAGIASRRHGAVPVLRALSRVERAPDSIAAF